jgi:ATP-binding cassette subfamily F protein 3
MLRIQDISYRVAGNSLFDEASAFIPSGHKVGVVGRNGIGKSTLFQLIRGEHPLEGGQISMPERSRTGSMAQETPATDVSLLDTVLEADVERASLLVEAETATDAGRIADIHTRLTEIQAHSAEARASAILKGLGFDENAQREPTKNFSGGWRMRVALAGLLFSAPDMLLLDEPTNYLDLEGVIWLQSFLAKYPHSALVISHDRALLNTAVNAILHVHDRKITLYTGGFDTFEAQRREALRHAQAAARKQDERKKHMQSYVDRFRYKASKAKQAQSRLKMIEKMEPINVENDNRFISFNFPSPKELSPPLMTLQAVDAGYGDKPVLRNITLRLDQEDRIALLGANGEGKSTLAKIISGELPVMNGGRNCQSKMKVGYFAQHQIEDLIPNDNAIMHLQPLFPGVSPTVLRGKLAAFGIDSEIAENPVKTLSGGQKARLSLLLATWHAPHLLILDEPTNHLDMESREALVAALTDYQGAVIIVSHDLHLLKLTADRLLLVKDGKVVEYHDTLDAYRDLMLRERGGARAAKPEVKKPKAKAAKRVEIAPLQTEVTKCEQRITTLERMLTKIDEELADPSVYFSGNADRFALLNKKRSEITKALPRAEKLWEQSAQRLENAKARA